VTCQPDDVVTPPARLAALAKQLDTMLQAVKLVRPALENFYATLSDEQKAQFEAIGSKRTT
jgi:LTXXQ motif family protein